MTLFVDPYAFPPDEGPWTEEELAEEQAWIAAARECDEGESLVEHDGRFL